jgi:hypothetical protein
VVIRVTGESEMSGWRRRGKGAEKEGGGEGGRSTRWEEKKARGGAVRGGVGRGLRKKKTIGIKSSWKNTKKGIRGEEKEKLRPRVVRGRALS